MAFGLQTPQFCTACGEFRHKALLLCRSGEVTQKMLDAPDKRLFIGIGGLEAASQLLGFVGASKLPGGLSHVLQLQPQHEHHS